MVDANGVESRLAFGSAGAQHDIDVLSQRYAALKEKSSNGALTEDDYREIESIQEALVGIPDVAGAPVVPMSTQSGSLCGGKFDYGFDSHFVVGSVGATAVARSELGAPSFGPPVAATAQTTYDNAKITPGSGYGSVVNVTHSTTAFTQIPAAIADWQLQQLYWQDDPTIHTSYCSASTYAYVSVTSSACTGGTGFISLTKNYPTCVSSP
jgi:hypothetical protein